MPRAHKLFCFLLAIACVSCGGGGGDVLDEINVSVDTSIDPVEISWTPSESVHYLDVSECGPTCEERLVQVWYLQQVVFYSPPMPAPRIAPPVQYGVVPAANLFEGGPPVALKSGTAYQIDVGRYEQCSTMERCKLEAVGSVTIRLP